MGKGSRLGKKRVLVCLALCSLLLCTIALSPVLATDFAPGGIALVSGTDGDGLRLRDGPSFAAATLAVMPEGAEVRVTGTATIDTEGNVWIPVSYGDLAGYALSDFLALSSDDDAPARAQQASGSSAATSLGVGVTAQVSGTDGQGLNVRQQPGYGATVLTVAPEGAAMLVIGGPQVDGQSITWWQVSYNGLVGWAQADYLRATSGESASPPPPLPGSPGATFRVYAHRLGLVGQVTANGHVIQENDRFVALPCACVLSSNGGNEYQVLIEYKGRSVVLPVWDVGPWNIDDNYWDPPEKRRWKGLPQGTPQAAAAYFSDYNHGRDGKGREVKSPAGIDIADGAFWHDLGMTESDWVTITFLWMVKAPAQLPAAPSGYEDVPTVNPGNRPPLDPVPAKDPSRYAYFPETGHNVPKLLMDYWSANGGWRVFGLPISEFFREVRVDGAVRFVQYFERAILTYDPAAPAAEAIQPVPIGYYASAPADAWVPVAPFEDSAERWYFPESGHSLSFGFKQYWIDHGGQHTLGLPITEEYRVDLPDGRWYTAQLFEYGRLEWWPDQAGTGREITHGLLVVEMLREAGWLPPGPG